MKAMMITAEGYVNGITISDISSSKLDDMKQCVGGLIELVVIDNMVLVVDEEGLLKRKPINPIATAMARKAIVGDVLVVFAEDVD